MLRVFLLSLFFFCTLVVNGQATRIYDQRDYGFGELSSNLITSVAQDHNGYIWIATEYGLNKFDGVRFVQYLHDVQDSSSISSNHVTILHRDGNSRLWIGCSNGLQYYDDNSEQFIRIKFPDQIAPHIIDILTRADGSLWVATSGWGFFSIDMKGGTAHSLEHVNQLAGGMYGRKLLEDSRHRVWIATDRSGVICISADLQHTRKFSDDEVPFPKGGKYSMTNTSSGDIILAYDSRVVLANKSLSEFTSLTFENERRPTINEMQLAQDGNVVMSSESGGIWHLNLSKRPLLIRQTELPNLDKNYSKASIRTFFQDKESNFWLGWFQRGLVFIPASSRQFEFWRILEVEESDSKKINVITTDQQGHIWYGVEGAGLFKADSTGHILKRYPHLQDIMQVLEDKRGHIWFLSFRRGLGKIDEGGNDAIYMDILPEKQTRTMVLGKNGKLYISTFGNGFVEYDPASSTSRLFTMNDTTNPKGVLGNDWINTILCGQNGLIWLGHHKGISCYDPQTQTFINQWANEDLSEQIVLSLLEDKDENVWIGTYNGLHKIDKRSRKLTSYTTNNGLSSNVISGLGEDKRGNIWCSTFNGINYVNPTEDRIVTYYTGDGLVDRSYNRSVYYQEPEGKIYFGGKQGITSFYPEQVQLTKYTHPVYVTNLYIRNQTIKPGDLSGGKPIYTQSLATANKFYFGNQDDSFTLELSTMDFNSPENIHYEYRLKGFNKTWNTTLPGVNLITYNNLSPGEHELEIRACKFGAYSESKFLTLHIMPPWYRGTLAYLVYLGLFVGILLLIANYLRERRLEKLHAYKLQLFTDISHEIRSPLTLVLSPIDKLIKNAPDANARETLQNMRRNAHRILNLVNQLLDIRKLESGQLKLKFTETNLTDLAIQCAQSFEQQAQERSIAFQVTSGSTYIPVWVDANSLDKILHNLLSNAFKYTPEGGTINVHITSSFTKQNTKQASYAEIAVTDTGPGIPEDDKANIFKRFYQGDNQISGGPQGSGIGLHLTRVLVEKHGGRVSAENRTDRQGSCFRIQIPMGTSHLPKAQVEKVPVENEKNNRKIVLGTPSPIETEVAPIKVVSHKTNFKVLIVDDEKDILRYVSQELQGSYKIISAENGNEAFQLALSQFPDLVISDVSMPDMDGFELVKKLKSNSTTNHIPVILLTAKINHEDRMQGIGLGADAYLTKPFLIDELLMLAENLIKNRMTVKGKYSGAQEQEGKVKTISFKSSDEILMERIVGITNKYLEDPNLNVQLLADEVGLSRVQLHRKVKALTGISTSEFIRNIRLRQAEKLLLEKQMNISQVAYALGFTNQTHFSTLFKKMYGLSPSEYINRHAKQHS
ncbi:hybrid sensor histidine kinase/response regulator transcription factor [Sphingobacterium haloxyli]|uniref:histidine kinase n=1 Tax=Sphingobacterium haloxyli TaxID=2100533 RepID=A0A2S9J505_9SPHI|nr:hybrid sensor histidine kinase/response regulator transcription factor [Sphingobacterium haloxyli]PRD47840.1 hybrid sensor histidine kinase/response regulator [Sphingobacterium haloxyli]